MKECYESQLRVWLRNMIILYELRDEQTDILLWMAMDTALREAGRRLTEVRHEGA